MGYFANGIEGEMYAAHYCDRCVHGECCAVWGAHLLHNYEECNNDKSILHELIPRDEYGRNGQCAMFIEAGKQDRVQLVDLIGRQP